MVYYSKTGFNAPVKEPRWTDEAVFKYNPQNKFEYDIDEIAYYITENTTASDSVKAFWEDVYERFESGNEAVIKLDLECRYRVGMKGDGYLQPDDPDEFDILNYKIEIKSMPEYVSEDLEREVYLSVYAYIKGTGILDDVEMDLYDEYRDGYLYGDY